MNVREAARRLEVSRSTVYNLCQSGELKCHRIGMGRGAIRISEEHLCEYLAKIMPCEAEAPTPPVTKGRNWRQEMERHRQQAKDLLKNAR